MNTLGGLKGNADVPEGLTPAQHLELGNALRQFGLALPGKKKEVLLYRIMYTIMDVVYNPDEPPVQNLSFHLSARLENNYTYMSNFFLDATNMSIERYYICHKIERVKQLLYEGLTLTEIAHKMYYPNAAHLSSQFEKVTGRTSSEFGQGPH